MDDPYGGRMRRTASARTLSLASLLLALSIAAAPLGAAPKVVCIDPGHGGADPGAVGCGLEEEDITLDVAKRLQTLLLADPDLDPILTRTSDTDVSLAARTSYANDQGADRFASIHCNASDGDGTGIETYCYTYGSGTSFDQRDRIQAALTDTWPQLPDRGGKTAGFWVIKESSMPATLSELAFIDHCSPDAQLLGSAAERQRAAEAHHAALRASLGLPPLDGTVTPPDPDTKGVLRGVVFEDQGVGGVDMSIRLPGATVSANGPAGSGSTTTDSPTGSWALSVPAGTYTVTASMAGYVSASRTCDVTTDGETWCSLGLEPGATVTPPATKGRLVGVVYEAADEGSTDMTVRLPGAIVSGAGPGASTASTSAAGADASWALEVPVGTWVVTASKAGHEPGSRVCTVSADADTWCSVGLLAIAVVTPSGPTGVLKGVAYLAGSAGEADMSDRLPGALIRAKGPDGVVRERIAPFPDALWQLDVPVGVNRVTAVLAGYTAPEQLCEVVQGQVTWCSTGLSLGESVGPGPTPGGADGTLSGIVYRLNAADTADQTTRLPNAIVTLTGPQGVVGSLVAQGGVAAWSKVVAPGTYFVVAALDGYLSSGRSCAVLSEQDTWCPIGLAAIGDGPDDPAGPDAMGGDDTSGTPGDDTTSAHVPPDAAASDDASGGDGFGYTVELHDDPPAMAGGCALSERGRAVDVAAPLLFALLGLLVATRRRVARVVGLPLVALLLAPTALLLAPAALRADGVASTLPVTAVHAVTPADGYTQPVWSPDGARLAVAGPGYASLYVLELVGGTLRRVAEGAAAGLAPVFSPAGDRLGVRAPGQRGHDVPALAVSLRGQPAAPVPNATPGRWLRFEDDVAHVRVGPVETRVSPEGDRACCGVFGPDGRFAAFVGLATGVVVHDTLTGRTHALGAGTHPRFSADGRALLFDRCADDGRRLTACTLHLADLSGATPVVHDLTGVPALATHPALAPDGRTLAFEANGAIWVGTVHR